ncbi:hypothetical protein SH668x_003751 [Planctomicrobium sp. SH668]|uniref:hypothetical protein n=1 Tax=Planctomicrobium sp. SH668 TaxID=3448126 RepID=UPI003F5C5B00
MNGHLSFEIFLTIIPRKLTITFTLPVLTGQVTQDETDLTINGKSDEKTEQYTNHSRRNRREEIASTPSNWIPFDDLVLAIGISPHLKSVQAGWARRRKIRVIAKLHICSRRHRETTLILPTFLPSL